MVITYNSGEADRILESKTLTIHRWFKSGETKIIQDLWEVVMNNYEESFDNLYELLQIYRRHTTVRSRAEIYKDEKTIEITNRSVIFPNILIIKK